MSDGMVSLIFHDVIGHFWDFHCQNMQLYWMHLDVSHLPKKKTLHCSQLKVLQSALDIGPVFKSLLFPSVTETQYVEKWGPGWKAPWSQWEEV